MTTIPEFLGAFSNEKKYFRILNGDGSFRGTKKFGPLDHDKVEGILRPLNDNHKVDVFFLVNDGGHDANSITRFTSNFADFDVGRYYVGKDKYYYSDEYVTEKKTEFRSEIKKLIADGVVPEPSIINEIRNGFHFHWLPLHDEIITFESWQKIQYGLAIFLNENIKSMQVDSLVDKPRIMRLPGMKWYKYNEKDEAGNRYSPCDVKIVSFKPELRYSQEYLLKYFPYNTESDEVTFDLEQNGVPLKKPRKKKKSTGTGRFHDNVNDGLWYVKFNNREVIEVTMTMRDDGQSHGKCPFCDDGAGHDIVIRGSSDTYVAFCNGCRARLGLEEEAKGFATQDANNLYSIKNEQLFKAIDESDEYSDLSQETLNDLTRYLEYTNEDLDDVDTERFYDNYKAKKADKDSIEAFSITTSDVVDEGVLDDTDFGLCKELAGYETFPLEIFPPRFRRIIKRYSSIKHLPVDYLACSLLAHLSICIGKTYMVSGGQGWKTYMGLWMALIGSPGVMKSDPLGVVTKLLEDKQKAYQLLRKEEMKSFKIEHEQWEIKHKAWRKQYADRVANGNNYGCSSRPPDDEPEEPELKLIYFNEATWEGYCKWAKKVKKGLSCVSPELQSFLGSFNKYNKGNSDLQNWIQNFDNNSNIVLRVGLDDIDTPEDSFCTIVGTTQPLVLLNAMGVSEHESGYVSRKLICYPKVGEQLYTKTKEKPVNELKEFFERIIDVPMPMKTVVIGETGAGEEVSIEEPNPKLIENADLEEKCYEKWYNYFSTLASKYELNTAQSYSVPKFKGYLAKFTGLIHLLWWYEGEQGFEELEYTDVSVERAGKVCQYFLKQSLSYWGTGLDFQAIKILNKCKVIVDKNKDEVISVRTLISERCLPTLYNNKKVITTCLTELEKSGRIEWVNAKKNKFKVVELNEIDDMVKDSERPLSRE